MPRTKKPAKDRTPRCWYGNYDVAADGKAPGYYGPHHCWACAVGADTPAWNALGASVDGDRIAAGETAGEGAIATETPCVGEPQPVLEGG